MTKRKLIVLSLPLLLVGSMTGCNKDNRTTQEKVFSKISGAFAVTGDYTLGQIMQMPDYETGEMISMDMPMGTSTYTTYSCSSFINIAQDIVEQDYHYDIRIDRDNNGNPVIYQLDPFTNEVVATSWTGDDTLKFSNFFSNPFIDPDDFDVVDSQLVLKEENNFNFETFGYILTLGNRATKLRTFTIDFDKKNNPTDFYAEFVDDTNAEFGFEMYYKYCGHFIDPTTVDVSPIPTPVPAQNGQDLLEAKFAQLRNLNYTATTVIYDGNTKVSDVTVKINPNHAYFDFENINPEYSYMNFSDKGYFQNENGLNYYKLKEGVPTATSRPNTNVTYNDLLNNVWKVSGYVFNVNNDGTYTLPDYEYAVQVHYYLGTESLYVGGLSVDKGSFNVTLTNDGLSYTYTTDAQYKVETRITAIGETTIPVDLTNFVEYSPSTNVYEWAMNQNIPEFDFVVNDITGNHPELIPFYEGTGRNDGFIDVGYWGMEQFGAGFTIAQQCSDEMEEMELFMNFMNQIASISGYTYHLIDDEYEYGQEGDDVHFKVSITPGFYFGVMSGTTYQHAVTLRVINLATPEGWVNPWDRM